MAKSNSSEIEGALGASDALSAVRCESGVAGSTEPVGRVAVGTIGTYRTRWSSSEQIECVTGTRHTHIGDRILPGWTLLS